MVTADWLTGLVLLLSQPLIPLSLMLVQRKLKNVSDRYWRSSNQLSAQFLDSLQGLPTLKLFNQSKAWGKSLHARTEELRKDTMRLLAVSQISLFGIDLVSSLGTTILTGLVVLLRLQAGILTLGQAAALLLLSVEIARPLALLGSFFHAGSSGVAAAQHIFAVLDTRPEIVEAPHAVIPEKIESSIRFEDVYLTYDAHKNDNFTEFHDEPESRPALSGVSFEVRAGETAALVGVSGVGKSSVLNLLLRFYDPQQGCITLGGHPLETLPLKWLRAQFALVPQDPYLFFGTFSENLRLAKPDATAAELVAAAKTARIHDFITSQPQGYETLIGERGLTISGGQLQRMAIARAILKDAPILLLDEATSNMDSENETIIQEALRKAMTDKTVLVVAHRLSTIQHADRILVMEGGRVVEQGKHDALRYEQGTYARLLAAQQMIGDAA
jgi:ABC-type multidrug transport system fused ATPase/permease subunit